MVAGKIQVNDADIYYEDTGKGLPLVFIHAGYMDSRMWDNLTAVFSSEYRVIRYDVRGYEKSSKVTKAYSDAEDLKSLMEKLGVQEAVLIGVSNGGRIALDFAVTYPHMVKALIPVDSGLKGYQPSGPEEEKLWENITIDEEKYLRLRSEGKFREAAEIDVDFWSNATVGELRESLLNIAEENVFTDETDPDIFQVSPTPPAFEKLNSLKMPVLIIVGSRDTPPLIAMSKRYHQLIKGSKFLVIEGADHLPSITRPEEFRNAVFDFLREL